MVRPELVNVYYNEPSGIMELVHAQWSATVSPITQLLEFTTSGREACTNKFTTPLSLHLTVLEFRSQRLIKIERTNLSYRKHLKWGWPGFPLKHFFRTLWQKWRLESSNAKRKAYVCFLFNTAVCAGTIVFMASDSRRRVPVADWICCGNLVSEVTYVIGQKSYDVVSVSIDNKDSRPPS